ncbi:MAG TPA: TGS domain-containing protein [Anaerolineae bacterium]|nr:TGS domain-containing protein [Anaerolineae bacterium]
MPTNLPPDYFEVEKQFRQATLPEEKIACLEEMLAIVPKHKGTDHLRADLRRRLSKLKAAAETRGKTGRQGSAYHIDREGAGQVVLVGVANVGKSALVAELTNADPEVAEYPLTTWIPTPGMMPIEDIQVQLIDTPPLNPDFMEPELLNLIRRADLVLLLVDLQGYPMQELEDTVSLLEAQHIMPLRRRDEYVGEVPMTFVPMQVLVTKCDDEDLDGEFEVLSELLGGEWALIPVSAKTGHHVDEFKRRVFDALDIVRVYSKPPGEEPDLSAPFVIHKGATVQELAGKVHKDFLEQLKSARVWGSATHDGQMVGRDHVLQDGDIVELRL